MKKTLNWLYENWMKGTPFLAFYTFILIWIYVKDVDFCLFLVWFINTIAQCKKVFPFYKNQMPFAVKHEAFFYAKE